MDIPARAVSVPLVSMLKWFQCNSVWRFLPSFQVCTEVHTQSTQQWEFVELPTGVCIDAWMTPPTECAKNLFNAGELPTVHPAKYYVYETINMDTLKWGHFVKQYTSWCCTMLWYYCVLRLSAMVYPAYATHTQGSARQAVQWLQQPVDCLWGDVDWAHTLPLPTVSPGWHIWGGWKWTQNTRSYKGEQLPRSISPHFRESFLEDSISVCFLQLCRLLADEVDSIRKPYWDYEAKRLEQVNVSTKPHPPEAAVAD